MSLPIFVINLDRVPDRMAEVQAQFDAVGVGGAVERFSAIDGQAGDFTAPGYAPATWRDRWTLRVSEQAVFLSHRAIWKQIVERNLSGAIICEDDILVSHLFGAALSELDLDSYGIIKLDGSPMVRRYGPVQQMQGLSVRGIEHGAVSAACYALSQSAARRLLAASEQFCETLDDFAFRPQGGVQAVQLEPAVAFQAAFAQTDDTVPEVVASSERGGDIARSNRKAEKGPAAYRLRKELRRMVAKLRQRMGGDTALLAKGGMIGQPELAKDLPPYRE